MRVDFKFFRGTDRQQNRLLNPASRMRTRGKYEYVWVHVSVVGGELEGEEVMRSRHEYVSVCVCVCVWERRY